MILVQPVLELLQHQQPDHLAKDLTVHVII